MSEFLFKVNFEGRIETVSKNRGKDSSLQNLSFRVNSVERAFSPTLIIIPILEVLSGNQQKIVEN